MRISDTDKVDRLHKRTGREGGLSEPRARLVKWIGADARARDLIH